MANSTPIPAIRFATLLLAAMLTTGSMLAQQGFYNLYPTQEYHNFRGLVAVTDHEYAFITTSMFYRVDGAGNTILQKGLKEGVYSELESVIRDNEGNFWIAAAVFDDVNTSRKVLYKLNAAGQVLTSASFRDQDSFENIRLISAADNKFFMAYQNRSSTGNSVIQLLLLDKNANTIWKKDVTDTISHTYTIKNGLNNSADIYYGIKATGVNMMISVNGAGLITQLPVQLQDPVSSDYYTADFGRTSDGGFIFAGVEQKPIPLYTDGLVYKADATGHVEWIKKFNIRQSDNFSCVSEVADGYIVLGASGLTDWADDSAGDIVLLKLDRQGNHIWTRAFGGAKMDYARHLRVLNDQIIFGGQSSYPAQTTSVPLLCKTDINGNLPSSLPFQPQPLSRMNTLEINGHTYPATLVQAAAGPTQSILTGGNFLKTEDDAFYPFVLRSNKEGKQLWYKQLSAYAATLKVFRQTRADEYIAVTEMDDLFANRYDIYKIDANGAISWTMQTGASNIKDVIATRDGGFLVTGSMDISFVNYETLLIKLDAAGNEQWRRTIGDLRLWETGRKIIETPEQDFLIAGNVQKEFDIVSSLYILKVNKDGQKIWSKTFTDGVATDVGYDVILTPDQQYLFAGTTNKTPFTDKSLLLIKTDKQGNLIWRKKQEIHLMDEGFQVMNSARGGFLITGTTAEPKAGVLERFSYVMKTNADGNKEWIEYFGKAGVQTMTPFLLSTSSGDTLLLGTTQERYGRENMFMVKLEEPIPGSDPQDEYIKLFPNPGSVFSTLWINQPAMGELVIGIYDQGGRKVKEMRREKNAVMFREDLSLAGLAPGMYYVTVRLNGVLTTKKLLVL